ncbi:nuclear transport factor 2 family protein [Sinomicrobium kalidii]|uniref:nuclear transport factor 2 family protein n=1 Tax=Sinomicrobium kalidii TaxID=2900738 RepID=UPI001E40E5DD|nr:nuclear transport factor 2 family protein [Sinomicrobium kalidii]UGU16106.1 nuclear transport factor 2 family protein [Sinomicrobium kalidii]
MKPGSEETEQLVQRFIQALTFRKLDELTALYAESVDWYIPGNTKLAPWLGKRESKKEIRDFFTLLWQNTEPVDAKLDHILADGNFAVITGEFSTKMLPTGKIVNSLFSIHITTENNKIVKYRLQEDSYAVAEALK